MEYLSAEQRRKTMQAVKSTGSKIEKKLAKELWKRGHRYRKNDKTIFGKPDFSFKKIRVVIFVDSEFWHGKNWKIRKYDHKTNIQFWYDKIERNIRRDNKVNHILKKDGWLVLRFWGLDIEKKIDICINKIERVLNERKSL